jgi:DNA-directed RNA polymerase subunit RPC12/RpoP
MMWAKQCQNLLELNKKTVNKGIRICVNCGSIFIHIENNGIFCKDCGSFFDVKEKKDE